jgi:hydrogenase-4 component B
VPIDSTILFQAAIAFLAFGMILPLLLARISTRAMAIVVGMLGVLGACAIGAASLQVLLQQTSIKVVIPTSASLAVLPGALQLKVDALSAFFLLLLSACAIPASLYSIGYLPSETHGRTPHWQASLFHVFLLSMVGVITADNGFLFLVFWETMTLATFNFILTNPHDRDSNCHAGFLYMVMAHVATAFLLFLFLGLSAQSGSLSFESFHHLGAHMPVLLKSALLACALIGFGTKVGLVPLHVWLPETYPAVPGYISGLMSGVMSKTAIYALLRICFDFLSPVPMGGGFTLALLALMTAVFGIIYALQESNLKRLIAYSSIENAGIILLPIGMALVFQSLGETVLAATAITASLFYLFSHGLFKSLLFMGAEAVRLKTHTNNMERLGGLIHEMPQTALLVLMGTMAACAFPPFGSFVGKWMIFQGVLEDLSIHSMAARLLSPLMASLLGLIGALSIAAMGKGFASTFLAMPRSAYPRNGQDVSAWMLSGMGMLAVLGLAMGPLGTFLLPTVDSVSGLLVQASGTPIVAGNAMYIQTGVRGFATLSPYLIFLMLLVFVPVAIFLPQWLGGKTGIRKEMSWACGITPTAEFGPTPTGLTQPLTRVLAKPLSTKPIFYAQFYRPLSKAVLETAHRFRPMQAGSLQVYLAYIVAALIVALLWMNWI